MSEVYGLIRKLGATSKYKGYYYVAEAVNMAKELQERPMKITKIFILFWQENTSQHHLMWNIISGHW